MTPLNNNLDGNSMRLAAIMDDLQRTMVRCGYTIIVEEEGGLFFTLGRRWCLASWLAGGSYKIRCPWGCYFINWGGVFTVPGVNLTMYSLLWGYIKVGILTCLYSLGCTLNRSRYVRKWRNAYCRPRFRNRAF